MPMRASRRNVLIGTTAAMFALSARPYVALGATDADAQVIERVAELERKNGGRLGVAILDLASGRRVEHRAGERFAMCSTFKFLAAACILYRVDKGNEKLDRRITYGEQDIVPNSPVTKAHIADGMTVAELCEATVTVSDNTAGNLLLSSFGGPAGFTAYARSLGDKITRLDRMEPELNDVKEGDERDTTTPSAMLENLRKVVLGDALSPPSRDLITAWLVATKTGDKRLRAGLPKDWKVGDKTGTSATDIANDIAVIWPPGRAPLIATVYYAGAPISGDQRNAVIADVGAIVASLV
jgi:beta-lactamase class A